MAKAIALLEHKICLHFCSFLEGFDHMICSNKLEHVLCASEVISSAPLGGCWPRFGKSLEFAWLIVDNARGEKRM